MKLEDGSVTDDDTATHETATTAEGDDKEKLEDATLDGALCWARERAEVVHLRLHDRRQFSAETRHVDSDLPEWEDGTVVEPGA